MIAVHSPARSESAKSQFFRYAELDIIATIGSERACQRAMAIQSLLTTAKLNGLEPCVSLRRTLEKLPVWPFSRIDKLIRLNG